MKTMLNTGRTEILLLMLSEYSSLLMDQLYSRLGRGPKRITTHLAKHAQAPNTPTKPRYQTNDLTNKVSIAKVDLMVLGKHYQGGELVREVFNYYREARAKAQLVGSDVMVLQLLCQHFELTAQAEGNRLVASPQTPQVALEFVQAFNQLNYKHALKYEKQA